jgi:uncharacterized protein (TIGR02246 family)
MKNFFTLVLLISSFHGIAQTEQDRQSIKQVIISFQEDFNEGSFKNAEQYTTEDWVHINPLGGVDKGQKEVLKVVREVHKTFLKGVKMDLSDLSMRFITPDVAIAQAVHNMSTYTTPDGTKHENERHVKTYVVLRKNGKWLLTHDHNTIVL